MIFQLFTTHCLVNAGSCVIRVRVLKKTTNSGKHNMSPYCFCGITQAVRRCSSSNLTQNSDMNTMFSATSMLQQYATQLPMFTWSQKTLCIGYYREKDRELLVSSHLKCSSAYKKKNNNNTKLSEGFNMGGRLTDKILGTPSAHGSG